MPLEVSPIPFMEQLPYTPKFVRPDLQGNVDASQAGPLSQGPASVAASAIIGPVPGGIAGPHNAIPALPDAGYTAPSLAAFGRARDPLGVFHAPRSIQSVYAGASLYGGRNDGAFHSPMSARGSEWSSSSMPVPSPRRVIPPPIQSLHISDEDLPRPQHRHHQHEHQIEHDHHHDQQSDRHRTHRSHPHLDADDAKSDASYYAKPKLQHRHSTSLSVIASSESSEPEIIHRRRSGIQDHPARTHISPPDSARDRTLIAGSSPLARTPAILPTSAKLPLSPLAHHSTHLGDDQVQVNADVPRPLALDHDDRNRRSSNLHRHRSMSSQVPAVNRPSPPPLRESAVPPPATTSQAVKKSGSDSKRPELSRKNSSGERQRQRHHSGSHLSHLDVPSPSERDSPPYAPTSADPYRAQHYHHGSSPPSEHHYHHHHHRHSGPPDHHQKPMSNAGDQQYQQGRQAPDSHRFLRSQPSTPGQYVQFPQQYQQHHHETPQEYQQSQRRRAVSLQGMERPNPRDFDGSGGGVGGVLPYPQTAYNYPGHGIPGVEVFDDGASVAGSAMTFMDGAMGGRTSQYGLPKYPHKTKPDYRRFCVQRGTADVFLD